jgi:hypothetical protein
MTFLSKTINFTSPYNVSTKSVVVLSPSQADGELPLIIVPHAANFSAEETSAYWEPFISRKGFIAAFPIGHGRVDDLCSFGWRGQMADLANLPSLLSNSGYQIDMSRIFAVGLSMGGQESLLLAGMHPEMISGIVAFNPVVDLKQIYIHSDTPSVVISNELGKSPAEIPDEYENRSPIKFYATISQVPTLLYWDSNDVMIPHQKELHCGKLHAIIKKEFPNSINISKSHSHGHFWVNPGKAVTWLMENYRK